MFSFGCVRLDPGFVSISFGSLALDLFAWDSWLVGTGLLGLEKTDTGKILVSEVPAQLFKILSKILLGRPSKETLLHNRRHWIVKKIKSPSQGGTSIAA